MEMDSAAAQPPHDAPSTHQPPSQPPSQSPRQPSRASVTRTLRVAPAVAWAVITDARQHEGWIPLTSITAEEPGIDATITAVSGPRWRGLRHGLVDRMVLTRFDPPSGDGSTPGVATFTKLGPVLLGDATITVVGDGAGRSRVTWSESVWLARGPRRPAAAVAAPLLRGMIGRVLRQAATSITSDGTVVPRRHHP